MRSCGLEDGGFDALLELWGHAGGWSGDTDGSDDRLAVVPQRGTETDASADGFFAIGGDSGEARFGEFCEELLAVDDGVFGAWVEAVDLEDAVGEGTVLEGGDDFSHGAAVGRQDAADLVGHADFVEGFDAVEDVDAVVEEVGKADGFVESVGEALEFGTGDGADHVRGLDEPAEDELGGELVGAVAVLLQVFMLFEGEQDAEEGGFGQADAGADVFEREGDLAVEAVEDFEGAADGAEVILTVGGGEFAGLKCPLGDAAADGFLCDWRTASMFPCS